MDTLRFEEVLERDGILYYTNTGTSMLPLIRQHRDIMTIVKKPDGRLDKHEVILFKRGEQYVLHRILKVNDGWYSVCGDNQYRMENVKDEQIIGVLRSVVRDGKTLNVTDPGYRFYVHLWCDLYPVRFFMLRNLGRIKRIIKRIIRRRKA